jgi:hypothetical protein
MEERMRPSDPIPLIVKRPPPSCTLQMEVIVAPRLRARIWLGAVLIKLAAWVMGVGVRIWL